MALREASKLSSKPRFEILSFIRSNLDQKFKKKVNRFFSTVRKILTQAKLHFTYTSKNKTDNADGKN